MDYPELVMRSAAHDIRGYLASAELATEHLCTHTDAKVVRSAERISMAIEQVVSICRNDLVEAEGAAATTDHSAQSIVSLLEQISALIAPVMAKPMSVSISVDDDVSIDCSGSSLFRILYNLSVNSAHAIARHHGSHIGLHVTRHAQSIRFVVADDGPGLPDHIIDHLYPRIDRRGPKLKRIGFGLMSAVSLAKKMHGALHLVESSPSGTTFCLVLPDCLVR